MAKQHIIICQGCLKTSVDKDMKKEMFFIIDAESHYSVHCIDCVQEEGLKIVRPYYKPRKKKTDK